MKSVANKMLGITDVNYWQWDTIRLLKLVKTETDPRSAIRASRVLRSRGINPQTGKDMEL